MTRIPTDKDSSENDKKVSLFKDCVTKVDNDKKVKKIEFTNAVNAFHGQAPNSRDHTKAEILKNAAKSGLEGVALAKFVDSDVAKLALKTEVKMASTIWSLGGCAGLFYVILVALIFFVGLTRCFKPLDPDIAKNIIIFAFLHSSVAFFIFKFCCPCLHLATPKEFKRKTGKDSKDERLAYNMFYDGRRKLLWSFCVIIFILIVLLICYYFTAERYECYPLRLIGKKCGESIPDAVEGITGLVQRFLDYIQRKPEKKPEKKPEEKGEKKEG
jgi:hypothetical protein